jgi:hypothetical protein
MASYMGGPRWTAYGPAKAGIVQLSKNCASAWAKDNIQVNTIWSGLIDTAMTKDMQANKEFMARVLPRIAAGRVGTPDDLAGVAAFLASRASDYVTGADIMVDGGLLWGACGAGGYGAPNPTMLGGRIGVILQIPSSVLRCYVAGTGSGVAGNTGILHRPR